LSAHVVYQISSQTVSYFLQLKRTEKNISPKNVSFINFFI
jgi:hypothetical protein